MRKFLIICAILFSTILLYCTRVKADPNMDGGGSGGGSQDGTNENFYSSGDDGVRITVIDNRTGRRAEGTYTVDYSKRDKSGRNVIHFGKISKLEYMGTGGYTASIPLQQSSGHYIVNGGGKQVAFHVNEMPTIISSSLGNSDIEVIKTYFNNEDRLRGIASRVGINYDDMTNGNYKIIIEPVIYLTFQGRYMALTAHEAAKLDIALGGSETSGGQLRAKFVSFTHKNLPLSIFLKKKELGINRWTGGKDVRVTNGDILSKLGIGILSFAPQGSEVDMEGADYTYRPNTEVITAIKVSVGSWGDGATVDNPITVRFSGEYVSTTEVAGIVIPPGGERLVWMKWRTPDVKVKSKTTIQADIVGGGQYPSTTTVNIKINPIEEKEPHNPTADDERPFGWSDRLPVFPRSGALYAYTGPVTSHSWHTYTCTKSSYGTGEYYKDGYGEYILDNLGDKIEIYETEYSFSRNDYTATLSTFMAEIKPDAVTAQQNPNNRYIKSGYGIEMKVNSNVTGNFTSDSITGIQTAVAYFPEFQYKTYRRIGRAGGNSYSDIEFPVNLYSIKNNRIHFLPIWYPDGEYKVYIEGLDAWTPAGMLLNYTTAGIEVKGSMWDDWYIRVLPNY